MMCQASEVSRCWVIVQTLIWPVAIDWDEVRASKLRALLEASIQRRFPKGLKVHVRSMEKNGCLTDLTQRLRAANLSITRAKVSVNPCK